MLYTYNMLFSLILFHDRVYLLPLEPPQYFSEFLWLYLRCILAPITHVALWSSPHNPLPIVILSAMEPRVALYKCYVLRMLLCSKSDCVIFLLKAFSRLSTGLRKNVSLLNRPQNISLFSPPRSLQPQFSPLCQKLILPPYWISLHSSPHALLSFSPKFFHVLFPQSHFWSSHEFFIILHGLVSFWDTDLHTWGWLTGPSQN